MFLHTCCISCMHAMVHDDTPLADLRVQSGGGASPSRFGDIFNQRKSATSAFLSFSNYSFDLGFVNLVVVGTAGYCKINPQKRTNLQTRNGSIVTEATMERLIKLA